MSIRFKLFGVWFVGFAACFACVLMLASHGYVVREQVPHHLTKIAAVYVPYLLPILAFWYAEDVDGRKRRHSPPAIAVAFAASVFFTLALFAVLLASFVGEQEGALVRANLVMMMNVGTMLAFVAGPAIGFFFSRMDDPEAGPER